MPWICGTAGEIEDPGYEDGLWKDFWEDELNLSPGDEKTEEMLTEIVDEMERGVLLGSSLGFKYETSQHDVLAERNYNFEDNAWEVILTRDLTPEDEEMSFAFAVHDLNAGGKWHHVSFPYTIGGEEVPGEVDITLAEVEDVEAAGLGRNRNI